MFKPSTSALCQTPGTGTIHELGAIDRNSALRLTAEPAVTTTILQKLRMQKRRRKKLRIDKLFMYPKLCTCKLRSKPSGANGKAPCQHLGLLVAMLRHLPEVRALEPPEDGRYKDKDGNCQAKTGCRRPELDHIEHVPQHGRVFERVVSPVPRIRKERCSAIACVHTIRKLFRWLVS